MRAYRDTGAEIIAHGRTNSERQGDFGEKEESMMIAETTERFLKEEGFSPKGWLGPWISQSHNTPEILKAHGYKYHLDWCHDDQPTWMHTENGNLLSVPYPQELNDIPAILIRKVSAEHFSDMIIDNFDEMLEQSKLQPLVMGIALHAYIIGQPFRIRQFRRAIEHIVMHNDKIWLTTPGSIAEHAEKNINQK